MLKICTKCNTPKPLIEFHKHKGRKDGYNDRCKSCVKLYQIKNKDAICLQQQNARIENRDKFIERERSYEKLNRLNRIDAKRKRYNTDIEYWRNYHNNWTKNKKKNDPVFKMKCNIRTRIIYAVNNKAGSSSKLLGCDINNYTDFLESQFISDMTWDNYGDVWHIDHIIPLMFFNLDIEEEQYVGFNYKNTRPLLKHDNLSRPKTKILLDDFNIALDNGLVIPDYKLNELMTYVEDINGKKLA